MASNTASAALIQTPEDVTRSWLSNVLNAKVAGFTVKRVGTGQVSEAHRITLQYDTAAESAPGPPSVILKVASQNESSRQAGALLGLYEREVRFYQEVAPLLRDGALAECMSSAFYPGDGSFHLLLGDAAPCEPGDDIRGASLEQARRAMHELGRLHAPTINKESLEAATWLNRPSVLGQTMMGAMFAEFVERYEKRVKPEHMAICKALVAKFDAFTTRLNEESRVSGAIHGDYRLDNMLFGDVNAGAGRALTIVDWQTVTWGSPLSDVAYFLGCSVPTDLRRAHIDELLTVYHDSLGSETALTIDQVKDEVKRHSFFGIIMNLVSPIFVEQTDRGDDMFMTMLDRCATMVLDLGANQIIEELSNNQTVKPLAPSAEDENIHFNKPGDHPLWQESWYFDFIDEKQAIGGYVRLGVDPSRKRSWYTAALCGPNRASIAFTDYAAPVPDPKDPKLRLAKNYEATQRIVEPLKEMHVSLWGVGESHADPAGILAGRRGEPVSAGLDLVWYTDGQPYTYRIATRYEIPCKVSGTITIGSEKIELKSVPGQRDHSWGPRDWWSMDWIWSAFHLDDGTHIHGLDLRIPGRPRMSMGYIQDSATPGSIAELKQVAGEEDFPDACGLPASTVTTISSVTTDEKPIKLHLDIMGHGPLKLVADDGRVGLFPRAWGRVKVNDGRTGVAWMEWMRNDYQNETRRS